MPARTPPAKRKTKAARKTKSGKRSSRGDAQKAAVMALLLEGMTPSQIERELKIPESSVRHVRAKLTDAQLAKIGEKRAGRLEELIWEHLENNFAAMRAIAQHVQSEEYIQGQDADAVAVLFGVINDKQVRVLDALERARRPVTDSGETDAS